MTTGSTAPVLNDRQRRMVRHALGFDGRHRVQYRNHYVVGNDSPDYAEWTDLVTRGLAHRHGGNELSGGDPVFWCTRELALSVLERRERLAEDFR